MSSSKSKSQEASNLRNLILGMQDGLVNVLGIVLGIAIGTMSSNIVLLAGIVATFAESISMAAVAYTSSKAAKDFYKGHFIEELKSIKEKPEEETNELRQILAEKGFKGELLDRIVDAITSDKTLWAKTMMTDELRLFPEDYEKPVRGSIIVGISAIIGSIVPIVPFVFLSPKDGIIISIVLSAVALFIIGALKGKQTLGSWKRSGIEMALIGLFAALAGYMIGILFGGNIHVT
jgi:predicted membrane protein (TIGR00267 family)